MIGKQNENFPRRRAPKGRSINPAVFGAVIGGCCAVCFALLMFAGAYTFSYTNDLRRELDEAKVAAADSTAAAHPMKRLGGGGDDTDVGGGSSIYDDDSFSIIQEMEEYMKRDRLKTLASKITKSRYRNARPYPNHVFDDIFPLRILRKISEEHPETALRYGCLPTAQSCLDDSFIGQHLKSSIANDKNMGLFTKIFMSYIKGSGFVTFLEEISGIPGIMPDPQYMGAGLHFTGGGGKLDIHADFNAHVSHKLERRVNILIFLNEDWPSEYGGHLELWSKDMKRCSQKVAPKMGRMAMFSTTDFANHGHPHALTAPPGRARRSIAMYYYTPKRPKEECLDEVCSFHSNFVNHHSTLFQTPLCASCEDPECNDLPSPNPFG